MATLQNFTPSNDRLVYNRNFIVSLNSNQLNVFDDLIPLNIKAKTVQSNVRKQRRRGKRGGRLVKARSLKLSKIPLPSIILANVQSLNNKREELHARIHHQKDFRNCCIFTFFETWLHDGLPNAMFEPDGFKLYRLDRSFALTQKTKGGGVCVIINNNWCTDTKIVKQECSSDLEYITVKCRPFHLPREFSCCFVTAAYIHPKANADIAIEKLRHSISQYENKHPDALSIITGDFNHANLKRVLPRHQQVVSKFTRGNRTLEKVFVNVVKNSYDCKGRSKFGSSDHDTILLLPKYKCKMKKTTSTTVKIKKWSELDTLKGCFESTDWSVFDVNQNLNDRCDAICGYIQF